MKRTQPTPPVGRKRMENLMRSHITTTLAATLAMAVLLAGPVTTQAAFISEYFDYGATDTALKGKGSATGGWAEAWQADFAEDWVANYSSTNVTYSASGYENTGNESTTGSAREPTQSGSRPVSRSFDSGMTGTIWASALLTLDNSPDLAKFDIDGGGMQYKNSWTTALYDGGSDSLKNIGTGTSLILLKVEMNVSGGANDTLSLWYDPDLTNGESGLGATDYTGSGADAFGATFDTANVSADGGGKVDALRISDDPTNAFEFVTTGTVIPEPATLALLGLGGAVMLVGRRKRGWIK